MILNVIRLELARGKDHPEGDPHHTYVLRAPLSADGRIDTEKFKQLSDLCSVVKVAPGMGVETGRLLRTSSGWAFSYAPGPDDDESVYRLGSHIFRTGEYITITEHDGVARTFRVVSVTDAVLPAAFQTTAPPL
jgi:hypothetical protein